MARIDTDNPGSVRRIVRLPSNIGYDGIATDGGGNLYCLTWNGDLFRVDIPNRTQERIGTVALPEGSGFYKDLAWDPVGQRLLALHASSPSAGWVNQIVEIDTSSLESTSLGTIAGLPHMPNEFASLGLAVDATGTRYVSNRIAGGAAGLYSLGGDSQLDAALVASATFNFFGNLRGLGASLSDANTLYATSGSALWQVDLGSPASNLGDLGGWAIGDIVAVPTPAGVSVAIVGVLAFRRRRSTLISR